MTTAFHPEVADMASKLEVSLPPELVNRLLRAYLEVKSQFVLGKHQPSELNGGHFAEVMIRLFEYMHSGGYTPFGGKLNISSVLGQFAGSTSMPYGLRQIAAKVVPIMSDVRNTRGVGHPAGDIDPNFSDSAFVVACANWVMTELIRYFYVCTHDEAAALVRSINQVAVPAIFDHEGTLRVLNTRLSFKEKTLLILYAKHPTPVLEADLFGWLRYSSRSNYRKKVLEMLDAEALIHLGTNGYVLTHLGIKKVETSIPLEIV